MPLTEKIPRSFDHVDTWVFDLDNTLYPHHVNLWQQVDKRITLIHDRPLVRTSSDGTGARRCRRTITGATAPPCAG